MAHVRSWQYSGSTVKKEFGSSLRRIYCTRSDGTFIFYFRYRNYQVGLIIDGSRFWVEGAITCTFDGEDLVTEQILQFARAKDEPDYILSDRKHGLPFTGSYLNARLITDIKMSIWELRRSTRSIALYKPDQSNAAKLAGNFQVLILYAVEAARFDPVFWFGQASLRSYVPRRTLKMGSWILSLVNKNKKLSGHALIAIKMKKAFKIVRGSFPRNLYQLCSSLRILQREVVKETRFVLWNAPKERKQDVIYQDYSPMHRGDQVYQSEVWLTEPWNGNMV